MSTTTPERVTLPTDAEIAEAKQALGVAVSAVLRVTWPVTKLHTLQEQPGGRLETDEGETFPFEIPTVERIGALFLFLRDAQMLIKEMTDYIDNLDERLDWLRLIRDVALDSQKPGDDA